MARPRDTNPAYARCRIKGFVPRSRHVLISEFTEMCADGTRIVPFARIMGIAIGVAIASAAQHTGAGGAGQRALTLVNTDIGFNMLTEFWPEIKRTLLLRHK